MYATFQNADLAFFFFDLDHLLAAIETAGGANLVCRLIFVAVVTTNEMIQSQLVVITTVVFTSARKFALGQWSHEKTP